MDFPEENCSHFRQEKINFESNCGSKPKLPLNKRKPILFSSCQLNELKQIFEQNKNKIPSIYIRRELAKKMAVSEIKIFDWFRYRVKVRKRISGSDCKSESKSGNNYRMFKSHELIELERVFEKNHYPDKNIINDLAQRMGVSKVKIIKWFYNKRYNLKRYVTLSTNAGDGYVDVITSSTGYVNYPPAPFYSPAKTMPPDHLHQDPQFQSQPDFSTAFSAEQYSSHHVPLTHQWTDSDTQSFSTVGSSTYSFPATVTYPQSVSTHF